MSFRGIVGLVGMMIWALAPNAGAVKVRIASYNVEWGVGVPGSNDYEAVKAVINRTRPDVIGFQELTNDDKDNWITLAAELGYPYLAFGASYGPMTGTQRLGYFSKYPIRNAAEVVEFPGAVELTRYPLRVEIDVPGSLNPLVLYNVHCKAMGDNSSQFRRAIESRRLLSNLVAYIESNTLNTEYVILGDFNDDVKNTQLDLFSSLPTGLPASYNLGSDVVFPVLYRLYPNDRFAPAGLEPLTLRREDSTSESTYGSGGRLDYILLSPDIRENPVGAPVGEIYASANDDGAGGLPKFGSPLPSTTSATASDHLLIFADINLIDLLPCFNPIAFVSEIVDHPSLAGANFIEIYNAGVSALNITNYSLVLNIDDVGTRRIPLSGTIAPGGTFTIAANASSFSTTYGRAANLANTNLLAIDGNDVIYFENSANQIIDAYGVIGEIANGSDFSVAWSYQNRVARRNNGISDPHPDWTSNQWSVVTGITNATPGSHTACDQADVLAIGPQLNPDAPRHTNDVSITVTLHPNLPASNLAATAFFRLNSDPWFSTAMTNPANDQWITSPLVIAPNEGDTIDYYVSYTFQGPNSASPGFTVTNRYIFPITGGGGGGGTAGSGQVLLNEIRSDGAGADTNDFIELIAPTGLNLQGYTIRFHNGAAGTTAGEWSFVFPSFVVPDDGITDTNGTALGFVVISQSTNSVPNSDFVMPSGALQQGPDGLILYGPTNEVLDAVAWEGPGDLLTDPGNVSTSIPPKSPNYLHVVPDDDTSDNSLNAPNDVIANTGNWIVTSATPGAINANQISSNLLIGGKSTRDSDLDSIFDDEDNCPDTFNPTQTDTDNDGFGDTCDPDIDNDGLLNENDNCPFITNPTQTDTDGDGQGDACDIDDDNDGIDDEDDNCPLTTNADQADMDNDGLGDLCDPDVDGDGTPNSTDTCPDLANPDQADMDGDGIGDLCDPDIDGDGVPNLFDNCPTTPNANQLDTNNDGIGNACTADTDNDTIPDDIDNCPSIANTSQTDSDKDGIGDVCDDCFGRFANINLLQQPFTSNTAPAGWTVRANNANATAVWRFNDPGNRSNLTGGSGNFAIVDSAFLGNITIDTDLITPALNLTNALVAELQFKSDFRWRNSGLSENINVDVSLTGAAGPWSNVWRRSGASDRGPSTNTLDLTTLAAGRTNVMIRFRYANGRNEHWWQIDDVILKTFACDPNVDTDSDGIRDIDDNCPEAANAGQNDLDADGLGDPCDPDRDGDGIPNDWETLFGLNPDNSNDGQGDTDGDGKTNREEYIADTNPTNTVSALRIEGITAIDGTLQIAFDASTNRQYQVLVKEGSITNDWLYDGFPFRGRNQTTSIEPASAEPAAIATTRYYRVMVIPPQ